MSYESLIAEYLDFDIPPFVPREDVAIDLPRPARNNIVYTIIGVRRCGKTYLMYQLMDGLAKRGVPRNRLLHFTFDDERVMPFGDHTLSELLDAYYKLVPEAREGCYLFFDEIQEAPYWTNFVRRVSEQHRVTIVLTGSSSKLLSTDIPTNFRGRSLAKEMWPLSFREYCRFNGVDAAGVAGAYAAEQRGLLEQAFDRYLFVGGFPAVQRLALLDRIQLLQGYAGEIVTKDVLERFGTTSFRVADRFARNALRSTGLKFSVNKQIKEFKQAGIPSSNAKLYALLDDLEDAHLLFKVSDYNLSIKDNPKSSYKVYSVDPGLALAVAPASHLDLGQRLETAVFLELKRRFGSDRTNVVATYQASNCPEVDFVVGDVALCEQYELVQVAVRSGKGDAGGASQFSKKYRSEMGNLAAAMKNAGLETGTLVTMTEEDSIAVPEGVIEVVPAWKWFLER